MTENQTVMAAVWLAEVGPIRRTWKRGSKRICSFIKLKNKITKKTRKNQTFKTRRKKYGKNITENRGQCRQFIHKEDNEGTGQGWDHS